MSCIGAGMLPMSNRKPERMKAGRKVAMIAIWPATNWLRATLDIKQAHAECSEQEKSRGGSEQRGPSPCSGTPKSHTAIATEAAMPPMPSTKYGTSLRKEDLADADPRDHQGFHRAALPLARDDHRGQAARRSAS